MTFMSSSSGSRELLAQPGTMQSWGRKMKQSLWNRRWTLKCHTIWQYIGIVNRTFITQHTGQRIPDTSWVSKKHLIEAKQYCNTTGYQPKWKRQSTQPTKHVNKYGSPICISTEYGRSTFASISNTTGIFNIWTNDVVGSPFVLCHQW